MSLNMIQNKNQTKNKKTNVVKRQKTIYFYSSVVYNVENTKSNIRISRGKSYVIIIFFNMDVFNQLSDVTPHIYSEKAIRLFNKVWSYVYFDSLHILYGKNAISVRISGSSEGDM